MQQTVLPVLALAALYFGHVAGGMMEQMSACGNTFQTQMGKCVENSGIDLTKLGEIQQNPSQIQSLNNVFKTLCANKKLPGMVDCVFNAVRSSCPEGVTQLMEKFVNVKGIKKTVTYMCDNLDVLMGDEYKACLDKGQKSMTPCLESKSQEIVEMVKNEEDMEKKVEKQFCYGMDLSRFCMESTLNSCPDNGKDARKILQMVQPPICKGYSLSAAGETKSNMVLLSLVAINAILAIIL